MKEMVGGCCVCSDERGWTENPLVYCDGQGCNVAVHQACYGIVRVPTGPWFCRKCESQERSVRMRCELCPQKDGALKQTDSAGWCHVVCALFIPEAWFANVQTMEPIVLKNVPPERFSKVCYICDENGRESKSSAGACMQCNRNGCKHSFHVTCAQAEGLLCEEAGNYGDNVKYCGYCIYHSRKMKRDSNIKVIPPFQPIPNDSSSTPESTPEKNTSLNLLNSKEKERLKLSCDKSIKNTKLTPHQLNMSDSSSVSSPIDIMKLSESEPRDVSSKDSSASINAKLDGAQTLVNLASSSVLNSAEPVKSIGSTPNVSSPALFTTGTSPNISNSSPGTVFSASDSIGAGHAATSIVDKDEGNSVTKRQRRISEEMAKKKKVPTATLR